ncbi:hypothetical protein [Lutispora thermophila]|uniref:Uncharacterized protein n=1 Tax=Lutispora thermophila DSM 19022 TaxID=1122184 RepID=A0A1M6D2T1_9FIRM|nr:hypothetical protein [Lutispora thermophila]SHI67423.1 hypothetical protein SAMN02745176_00979 [Lutispora thermophila DSM 19022]
MKISELLFLLLGLNIFSILVHFKGVYSNMVESEKKYNPVFINIYMETINGIVIARVLGEKNEICRVFMCVAMEVESRSKKKRNYFY